MERMTSRSLNQEAADKQNEQAGSTGRAKATWKEILTAIASSIQGGVKKQK
jgi:hypothetical protein